MVTTYNPEAPLYIVMIDYGRAGLEASVIPGTSFKQIVREVLGGQFENIAYIHELRDWRQSDITADVARAVLALAEEEGSSLTNDQIDFLQEHKALPVWAVGFEAGRPLMSAAE